MSSGDDRDLRALNRELMQRNLELSRALEERDKLLPRLVENEKLAALGALVAGFAHEINTPVGIAVTAASTLSARVEQLLGLLDQEEVDEEDLQEIIADVQQITKLCISNLNRASRLVSSFKRVSIEQTAERKENFSVQSLIADTVATLQPTLKQSGVVLSIEAEDDVELHNAPGALSQVITNLVLNVVKHAYPEGETFANKRVAIETWRDLDNYFVVEIKDFGVGMSPDLIPRIFEPFETTARGKGGTGLGLTITRNLVTGLYGGTISVDSAPGEGTTFYLRLPIPGKHSSEEER